MIQKLVRAFYGMIAFGFLVLLYFYIDVQNLADKLVHYKPALTTQIFDRNGELIANSFKNEHRLYVRMENIPPRFVEAIVAIEDTMFFEHPGINFEAIFRAIIKDVAAGRAKEGASTLTQQVIKNTLLSNEKSITRKIKEAILAFIVENRLTKEEILERYLNQVYLGHGYYGIRTAVQGYFHKPLHRATLKEVCMIMGMPKAPSSYDPTRHYELSMGRANRVITRMNKLGWIDTFMMEEALMERPVVFNDDRTQIKAPYVVDEVMRQLSGEISDLKTGGYVIHTTIDLEMQKLAREGVKLAHNMALERSTKMLKRLSNAKTMFRTIDGNKTKIVSDDVNASYFKQLNGAMVVTENKTGNLLAIVGGYDHKISAFNRASQSKRQPGSAFKPFIYQVALDLGYSALSPITDIAKTYEYEANGENKVWQPDNHSHTYKGIMNLKEAVVYSRNLATINLVTDIGLKAMHEELTNRFGIKDIPKDLSLSLGSIGLSPLELSSYYTIFSNYGKRVENRLVTSIESPFYDPIKFDVVEHNVTTPEQAYLMIDIMREVVNRGTGRRAQVEGMEVAGKTGTTNKSVDGWFCGYTPSIQALVWFGNDDNSPMQLGEYGGTVACPAFKYFFTELLKSHPELKRTFKIPEDVIVSRKAGKTEYFTEKSQPPKIEDRNNKEEDENLLF